MAGYNAKINITADSSQAQREIQRLIGSLNQVEKAASLDIGSVIRSGGIQKSFQTIAQLNNAVSSLRSNIRSISAPGGEGKNNFADAIRQAATASNQFFDSLAKGNRGLANTTAGLRDQANAFATLASNINSADKRFTDYVQGAQSAQDKSLRPLFRQFEALRKLYEEGVTGLGTEIKSGEMGASLFQKLAQELPQTEAALRAFSAELTRVRGLIGSESVAAFGIEQQIIEIEKQLLKIEQDRLETRAALNKEMSAPVQGALSRMEGRAADPFGISDEQINESLNTRAEQYVKQQEELDSLKRTLSSMEGAKYDPLGISDNQVNQGLEERASLYMQQRDELASLQSILGSMEGRKYDPLNITDDQINQGLEERARNYAQQARDIAGLQQALGAMESRQINWGSALGISESDIAADRAKDLEVQWTRLNEAAQRIASQAPQAAAALQAFKFETLAKDADAYTRALLNQQRTLDEYADSANRAAAASAELGYGGELPALRPAGFTNQDVRIKNLLDDQTAAAKIVADLEMDLDRMVNQFEIENIERELKAELDRIDTILDARTKAGEKWWAGEKKRLDEKSKIEQKQAKRSTLPFLERQFGARGSRAISEGLIGGAFPLLFGQGLGAAVGGGAGGVLGGLAGGGLGFGLSLVGTALGTAFDGVTQAAQETGRSLRFPIEGFEKLRQASLISTRQQEYYISKLIEVGRLTEAAGEIQSEIIRKIGVRGVSDLRRLDESSSELSKAWAEFNLQLQAALAGPMADLLKWVAGIVAEGNRVGREAASQQDILSGLSPSDRKRLEEERRKIFAGDTTIFNEAERRRQEARLFEQFRPLAKINTPEYQPTLEEQERVLDQAVQNADRIRSLNEQWISLQRSADDIRRSNEEAIDGLRKRAIALEKEAVDFRRSIEDQIADKRLEVAQKLYDNERAIRQLSIDALDIQLQRAAGGLDPIAASIVDAAREYVKIRDEGQADIERSEIQLALDLQRIENETNRQRIQIEDRVYQMTLQREEFANDSNKARMQLERQSLDYAVQVEKYRLDMTRYRYDMEIDLEKKKKIAAEGGLTGVQLNEAGVPQIVLGSGVAASVPMMTGVGASGEKAVQEELAKRGYNPAQMAAIMGSIRQESTFNPYAQEKGGTGRGLFQWSFGRAAKVPAFTGDYKTDIKNQIDLFEQELRTSEKKAGEMLARATTLDQAAAAMKQFERYGVAGKRYEYMRDYFSRFTGGAGMMSPLAATPPAAAATPGVPAAPPTAPVSPAMSLINFPATPGGVQYLDLIEQSAEAQALNAEAIKEANDVQKRQIELRVQAAQLALQEKVLSPLRQYQEQNRELDFELEKRKERNRLLTEGVKPEIVEGELRVLEISRALNSVLQGLEVSTNERTKAALAMAGVDSELVDSTFRLTEATLASLVATTQDVKKQEELREKLQSILDLRNELAGKAKGAAGAAAAGARDSAARQAEGGLKIQDFIAQATAELTDFESLAIRVSQGVGDAVGNSLASGITGLIEGTTTAKEIFAGFLKDVGQILIREGTKIIATYIAIGIAKQFAGLFGGGVSGGAGGAGASDLPTAITSTLPIAANGAYFADGVAAFAKGGMFTNSVVSSPTLFQFADGGVTRTGLMGEAGPEAIMPLKRGADGKLGVQVADNREFLNSISSDTGEGAMEPGSAEEAATLATRASVREIERLQENRTQIMTQQMEAERRYERERIEQMASTPGNLNIKYESQVINNVEYVTRDQAERMAAQSALRGRELAIGALQNSVKTRKRVGI